MVTTLDFQETINPVKIIMFCGSVRRISVVAGSQTRRSLGYDTLAWFANVLDQETWHRHKLQVSVRADPVFSPVTSFTLVRCNSAGP